MATYERETTITYNLFKRLITPGEGTKYLRLPYNLVTLDDGSGDYIEPMNDGWSIFTWNEAHPPVARYETLIVDVPPGAGVTEIF